MIKKRELIFWIVLLVLFISLLSQSRFVSSAGIDGLEQGVEDIRDKSNDVKNALSEDESRNEYLREQWGAILSNSSVGNAFSSVNENLQFTGPFWQIVLGIDFSLSFKFIIVFLIWVLLLISGFNLFTGLQLFYVPEKYSTLIKWGIFFAFFVLISSVRIPVFLYDNIISFILERGSLTYQIIGGLIVMVVIIVGMLYSGKLKSSFASAKNNRTIKKNKAELEEQKKEIEDIETGLSEERDRMKEKEDDEEIKKSARDQIRGMSDEEF